MRGVLEVKKTDLFPERLDFFNNCHASTLVKTGADDFLCAYMAGTREGAPDMSIWLSRCRSGVWQDPVRIRHSYGLPHWNPVLHFDGNRIYLFYKTGAAVPVWIQMFSVSDDLGNTWSESRELVSGDASPRGPVKNKLLVTTRGTWLAPCSMETDKYWDAYIDVSGDQGKTWKKCPIPIDHGERNLKAGPGQAGIWGGLAEGALWENQLDTVMKWDGVIQPALWESGAGKIHALMRSTRGNIYRSDSADDGQTWCDAYPAELPNNNSGIDAVKMDDGTVALVYNPISGNWSSRSPLSLSFSEDNGGTWSAPFHLEIRDGEYSYPAVLAEGNSLHISYTSNRKIIVYCKVESFLD